MTARLYFDWNATAPLHPAAKAAMIDALDAIGNPSSVHAEGRRAKAIIEMARDQVAQALEVDGVDVVFTSGASESNATVIAGGWDTIILSDLEHDSVIAPARRSSAHVVTVPVLQTGLIDVGAMAHAIQSAPSGRTLVVLQAANNETGVVQPVDEVAAFARGHGAFVLVDAVQMIGRLRFTPDLREIDFVTVSGHKLGGPKGVGALIMRSGATVPALIAGGGQERRRRAGTENVAAIAGFGAAAAALNTDAMSTVGLQRHRLEQALCAADPRAVVIGAAAARLPNTTCIASPGRSADAIVIRMDLAGAAISAGAACSSGKVGTSRVLTAMGLPIDHAKSAVRISMGPATTDADVDAFITLWTSLMRPAAMAA